MSRSVIQTLASILLLSVTPASVFGYHDTRMITERDLHAWSHWFYHEIVSLIDGPQRAPFVDHTALDCAMLYERRLALYHEHVDTNPAFTDDPRNKAAIFIGTIFTPAFLYLPYSAIMAYRAENARIERVSRIDALAHASAQHDCFQK